MPTYETMHIDESIIKVEKRFLLGQEIEFGVPDNAELRSRLSKHYQIGQELLKDFKEWMIGRGLAEITAVSHVKCVFAAMCLTYDQETKEMPVWEVLRNDSYSPTTLNRMRAALKHYAIFSQDPLIISGVELSGVATRPNYKKHIKERKLKKPIISRIKIARILEEISKLRGDPRLPWMADCLTLCVKGGFSAAELVALEKEQIKRALAGSGLTTLSRIRSKKGPIARFVATGLIRDELEALINSPYHWNTLADLITPTGRPDARARSARLSLTREMVKILKTADVPHKNWGVDIRKSLASIHLKQSKNLVAAAQLLGIQDIAKARKILSYLA